jgi:hypothetical protein
MAEVIPFPQNQEANVERLRYEIEEKLFAASDILDRFPDVPDKQMLRDLLSAAAHLVGPAYQRDAWRYRARLLRNDLTPVLEEINDREKAESR